MARPTALRRDVAVLVLGVKGLQVIFGDRDAGLDLCERPFGVLQAHRLRRLEGLAVLGVPGRERCLVRHRRGAEAIDGQQRDAHLALLILEGEPPPDLGGGQELRDADGALELRVLQAGADVGAELLGGDADLREPGERQRLAVLAVDLEGGLREDLLLDPLCAHPIAAVLTAIADEPRPDEALQHPLLQLRTHIVRDIGAELLLPLRLLVAPDIVRFLQRDLLAVHLGRPSLGAEEVHADHARRTPEREDEREGGQDEPGQDFLALEGVADFLEHG